jgi:hypothetical protein
MRFGSRVVGRGGWRAFVVAAFGAQAIACGGAKGESASAQAPARAAPNAVTPAASAPPPPAPAYLASVQRVDGDSPAWVIRIVERCAAPAKCSALGRAAVFARHYDCTTSGRCEATNALDRLGITDENGRLTIDPRDGNGRLLAKVEVFAVSGDKATVAAFLRDDHRMIDDGLPGLARVGEIRIDDSQATSTSATIKMEGLETEETMWEEAVARCRHPLDESSCDGVREYQRRYPNGAHAQEVFGVLFDATRDLQRQFGERMQADSKRRIEEWRNQREEQQRKWEHQRRENASRSACLSACYRDSSNTRAVCDTRCQ